MTYVEIVKKNIAQMNVDCIVVPTNSTLTPDGGAAEAVFRAAGYAEMKKACDAFEKCDVADFVATPGFQLKAKCVFHVVGPSWEGGQHYERFRLQKCYRNTMRKAKELGFQSIAFSLISAGVKGYPLREAWEVAIRAVLSEESDLKVYFTVQDDYTYEIGQQMLLTSSIDAEIFETVDKKVLQQNIENVCHSIVEEVGKLKEDTDCRWRGYPTAGFSPTDIMLSLCRKERYREHLRSIEYMRIPHTEMSAAQVICKLYYYRREGRLHCDAEIRHIQNGDVLKLLLRLDDLQMQYYEGTPKEYDERSFGI